jgi:hypothetical protein
MMWHLSSFVVREQGTFRNCWGYFNETWCEDTFGNTPRVFLIFVILPILWPPGGHLENQTCHLTPSVPRGFLKIVPENASVSEVFSGKATKCSYFRTNAWIISIF